MHTCIHTNIHTYMHTRMHVCIHACIHTYIHTYIHTFINTYARAQRERNTQTRTQNTHTHIFIDTLNMHALTYIHTRDTNPIGWGTSLPTIEVPPSQRLSVWRLSTISLHWTEIQTPPLADKSTIRAVTAVGPHLFLFSFIQTEVQEVSAWKFSLPTMQWTLDDSAPWHSPNLYPEYPCSRWTDDMEEIGCETNGVSHWWWDVPVTTVGSDIFLFSNGYLVRRSSVGNMEWTWLNPELPASAARPTARSAHTLTATEDQGGSTNASANLYLFGGATTASCPVGFHHCRSTSWYGSKGRELLRLHGSFYCDRDADCHGDDDKCLPDEDNQPTLRTGCVTAPPASGLSNETWKFEAQTATWTQLHLAAGGKAPTPRARHASAAVGATIYLFGGDTGSVLSNELWKFDTLQVGWQQEVLFTGQTPSARHGHSMVSVQSELYIFGGDTDSGVSNELWRYSTLTRHWDVPHFHADGVQPRASKFHTMDAVGSSLWAFGGQIVIGVNGDRQTLFAFSDELWRFDLITNKCALLSVQGPAPSARYGHSMTSVDSHLFVFGGKTVVSTRKDNEGKWIDGGFLYEKLTELWKFNTQTFLWTQLFGVHPSARSSNAMASVGSRIWVHGGLKSMLSENDDDMDMEDLDDMFFRAASVDFPPSFSHLTRVYDGDTVVVKSSVAWDWQMDLCTRDFLPCSNLTFLGSTNSTTPVAIRRVNSSRISCSIDHGCTSLTLSSLMILCDDLSASTGPLQLSGTGVVMTIQNVIFLGCITVADGGCVRCISMSTFAYIHTYVNTSLHHSLPPSLCRSLGLSVSAVSSSPSVVLSLSLFPSLSLPFSLSLSLFLSLTLSLFLSHYFSLSLSLSLSLTEPSSSFSQSFQRRDNDRI